MVIANSLHHGSHLELTRHERVAAPSPFRAPEAQDQKCKAHSHKHAHSGCGSQAWPPQHGRGLVTSRISRLAAGGIAVAEAR